MGHSINNRNYLEISGTFGGSEETTFEVKVTGDNNSEVWKYRTKVITDDGWTDYSSTTAIVVDTAIQLGSTGVYIKFTRPESNDYQDGDIWSWSTGISLSLDGNDGTFDYIETIDVDDTRNLLALSKSTGRIAVIEKIDTDNPIAQVSSELINLGSSDNKVLDFEKKNKELYVAKGPHSPPQWIGYSKNGGFQGDGALELKSVPALDVIDGSDNPQTDAFDMSCVLRGGGGADLEDAKIIVGINTTEGRVTNKVFVMNIPDEQLFEFGCDNEPIAIKRWYGIENGTYCDGFAVMRKPSNTDYCVDIDLWDLNTGSGTYAGQQANLYNTIHIEKPSEQEDVIHFSDFLIVPKVSDMDHADQKWTILLSRRRHYTDNWQDSQRKNYEWLWTTGEVSRDVMDTQDKVFSSSDLDDITPRLADWNANPSSRSRGDMFYMAKGAHAGADRSVPPHSGTEVDMPDFVPIHASHFADLGIKPVFRDTSLYCLEFGGFNAEESAYGKAPIVYFTISTQTPKDRGTRNFYGARSCLTANQITVMNGSTSSDDALNASSASWTSKIFGPFLSNNTASSHAQIFRGVCWITYAIPLASGNDGSVRQKAFCHMTDWNASGSRLARWRSPAGSDFSIPNWLEEGGEGAAAGSDVNKGNIHWDDVPSKHPNFNPPGRIIISTTGVKRKRHLLSYVRAGNRKFLTFRFGLESGYPQSLSDSGQPQLFPNDWSLDVDTDWDPGDNQTAYELWNKDDSSSQTNVGHFGSTDVNMKKKGIITSSGDSGDDKLSYRASEHGNVVLSYGGNPAGTQWYPEGTEKAFVMSVPNGDHQIKQLFKVVMETDSGATNQFSTSASQFSVQTPTEGGTSSQWSGIACAKVFYKASFIYDGYQETALVSTTGSFYKAIVDSVGIDEVMNAEIRIADSMKISDRVTGVAVYRATSTLQDTLEPETLYRFIQEIPLYQFNHNETGGYQTFTVKDTGDAEGTYEGINGLSETIYDLAISYGVNTQQNGYHFVGNCSHKQIPDSENYIFRSQPGKFSIFDWTKDFIQLPFVPVALKGFMGKVYAFSNNQVAVINPNTLFIEDVIEGTGCINSKTILVTDSGMMWADYRNIYLASPGIKPIGDVILNVDTHGWLNIPTDNKDSLRCGYDAKRKAFLLFYTIGTEYRCWCYSTQKNRWDLLETPKEVLDTALTKDGSTILLLKDNSLSKFLAHTSNSLDWYWESKKIQMGNTMVDKKVRNMKVEGNQGSLTTMKYKLDGDASWKGGDNVSNSFTGTQNKAYKLQSGDRSKKVHWIKLRIDGDNSSAGSDVNAYATSLIFKQKRPK